jgi:lysophospholipase L1-like esterase
MKTLLYILLLIFVACGSNEKDNKSASILPPFRNDIQNFKKQDSASLPPKNSILFIGSSSFTLWKDVQNYFPGYTIINRGFGGSTLLDQIRYAHDIIFPYQPRQIVIYCGENDLASSDTVTAKMVFNRFKQLYDTILNNLPYVNILYISMKPSPSRRHLFDKMRDANALINDHIELQNNFMGSRIIGEYIDVYTKMLNANGEPIPDLFLKDSLHMNANGYAIWQKEIQPFLLKEAQPVLQK